MKSWMKSKKSKHKEKRDVDLKLFKKILKDALETQEEWNTSPLTAVKSGRSKADKKRKKELAEMRDELEDESLKDLQKRCRRQGLSEKGDVGKLTNRCALLLDMSCVFALFLNRGSGAY